MEAEGNKDFHCFNAAANQKPGILSKTLHGSGEFWIKGKENEQIGSYLTYYQTRLNAIYTAKLS